MNMRTDRGDRCGVVIGEHVVDVRDALAAAGVDVPAGVRELLGLPDWRALVQRVLDEPAIEGVRRDTVDIGPVISDPRKILFLGANTRSHLEEAARYTKADPPQRPMVASKTMNAINGPYDPIVQPDGTHAMDYEAELGVVIGARARHVPEDEVASVVAGYTVCNDVSDREFQLSTWEGNSFYRTHFLGKSFDGFAPCGPVIVTRDELPEDLSGVRVRCTVDGRRRQDGTLDDLCFSVEEAVSYISRYLTLEPGDLIMMGSPAGVGHFEDPPAYVTPGGVVRCEVEGIGHIENRVVAEDAAATAGSAATASA